MSRTPSPTKLDVLKAAEAPEPDQPLTTISYAEPFPGVLAAEIKLPPETLDALYRKGLGPPVFLIGRRRYCRRCDWHRWLDAVATGKIDARLAPGKRRPLGIAARSRESDRGEVDATKPPTKQRRGARASDRPAI